MERKFGPRFHPNIVIPEASEGNDIVKFHGRPVEIPSRQKNESLFGKSRFTMRQIEALLCYEQARRRQSDEDIL